MVFGVKPELLQAGYSLAGNGVDVAAGEAEIRQFAVRKLVKFCNCVAICAPIGERFSHVHGVSPFEKLPVFALPNALA